ncbi:MAG: RHS repeat domain-containing protein [Pseudomonadota bacterium]
MPNVASLRSDRIKRPLKRIISAAALLISFAAVNAYAGVSYKYDALGRVIEADFGDKGKVQYDYDALGNRTVVDVDGAANIVVVPLNGFTIIPLN